ncbi:MAG: thioredoxin family protein [Bacteroidota bacterium]
MKKILLLILPMTLLLFSQCKTAKKTVPGGDTIPEQPNGTAVHFTPSPTLSDILDEATRTNKLVFVDFYATWCLPCKIMDEEVFTHQETADFLNENFINYKVDGEKGNGQNLAVIFEVTAYPTLLFLDQKGRVLERKVGAAFHAELRELGQRALSSQFN